MKRIVMFLLSAVFIIGTLSSCSNTSGDGSSSGSAGSETANIEGEWQDLEFMVNGKTFTLPCSYEEFANETGLTQLLEDGVVLNTDVTMSDGNHILSLTVGNFGNLEISAIMYRELVDSDKDRERIVEVESLSFEIAQGITVGKTLSDVSDAFGDYASMSEEVAYGWDSYYWTVDGVTFEQNLTYSKQSLTIEVTNGDDSMEIRSVWLRLKH